MFKVVLLPKAEKTFAQADAPLARKLAGCFASLETDPLHHPNIKPLTRPLKGMFRFRAGDYRILYQIDAGTKTVYVVRIVHRKEAYQ
jgi:mRNA interferase RelE/StbE